MTALKNPYARKFTIDVLVRRSVNNFNTVIIIEALLFHILKLAVENLFEIISVQK